MRPDERLLAEREVDGTSSVQVTPHSERGELQDDRGGDDRGKASIGVIPTAQFVKLRQ